ncbi:GNAT family N-acetyltransferase [Sporosarcina contaminans]|uniref:GNAT family N-acetyltransferase n=1 Tax=Sporosarcina contaminans TaxID=633403 RepID=A0ABW3TV09_9BACL
MKVEKIITDHDLQKAFHIRKEVFVKEQGVPLEDEFDEFDVLSNRCDHLLAYFNDEPVGTGRIKILEGYGKLERICILKPYRKFGIGKVMITALEEIAKEKGMLRVILHGQTQAEGFYQKLGYETASEIFMEDGIPHVLMSKDLLSNDEEAK